MTDFAEVQQQEHEDNKNGAIFEYLEQHITDFIPTEEETAFITSKLEYVNGSIRIGGWFILPYIGTIIALVMLIFTSLGLLTLGNPLTVIINVAYLMFVGFLMYNITKKKRLTVHLFKGYYILAIGLKLLTLSGDYTAIVVSMIWLAYFFRSKRVKFTFVE